MEAIEYSKGLLSKTYALGVTLTARDQKTPQTSKELEETIKKWLDYRLAKAKFIQFTMILPETDHEPMIAYVQSFLREYSSREPALKKLELSGILVDERLDHEIEVRFSV